MSASSRSALDGNGECFVFRFGEERALDVFRWTQTNDFFMFSSHERVGMGGGGEGFAFVLDADFFSGGSYRSETFGNPRLTSAETFRVRNVEVWGFDSVITDITRQ